jgi:hypothetical protein
VDLENLIIILSKIYFFLSEDFLIAILAENRYNLIVLRKSSEKEHSK